jgi:hypothetical protein
VIWSLSTATAAQPVSTAAAVRPSHGDATRTTDDAARPPPAAAIRTAAAQPTSTQGKPTFVIAAAGIPDAAHASIGVSALPGFTATAVTATAVFSIHNNQDDDWEVAPIGPHALGNAGATGQNAHHVDHCGLQIFDFLASSDFESEDEVFDASEFDHWDGLD